MTKREAASALDEVVEMTANARTALRRWKKRLSTLRACEAALRKITV